MFQLFRADHGARRTTQFLSIRGRLVVLALLIVVPLMIDRVRLLEASRAERIDAAAAEVLDLTKRGAINQREIITTVHAVLKVTARAYATGVARGDSCNLHMKDIVEDVPWITGMLIIGPEGRVICATLPSAVGLDMSDRPHYHEAIRTRSFVVSDYLIGRPTRTPTILAAYPAQAIDPEINAVVVASVNLHWIGTMVASLENRAGSVVMLIDNEGRVLAGDRRTASLVGRSMREAPLFAEMADRLEGTGKAAGLDGTRLIFGFMRIPLTDARLVVGYAEADVLRRVDREIQISYVELGFFTLLVLLAAWLGGERLIVNPTRTLARTAARLGRGDLTARAERQGWAKEFEPLAHALNDMAQKLAARDSELRATNLHLARLASIDALSGLANRRGFDERLTAVWQRALTLARPVGLLMVDVDYFKQFNDRYGHVEGDDCLRRIGRMLMESAGGVDDLPARYGGEEFALLLPGTYADKAMEIAERLRRSIEKLDIAHAGSPLGRVTVSVGVATMAPCIGEIAESLIDAADAGLYAAKRRGRNTVVLHGAMEIMIAS